MTLVEAIAEAKQKGDFADFVSIIPYFRFLGLKLRPGDDGLLCIMPADQKFIGNPMLPAIHGGVIGALLEVAAQVQLIWQSEAAHVPKTITATIDYLRSAKPVETYAQGIVTRHGRRVANVRVEAWQEDRSRPVAAAHLHFLLT